VGAAVLGGAEGIGEVVVAQVRDALENDVQFEAFGGWPEDRLVAERV
jgi:hypothetical protein